MLRSPRLRLSRSTIATGSGLLWGSALLVTFGWAVPPGPETAGQWAILVTLCATLAILHTGLIGSMLAAAGIAVRFKLARAADAAVALVLAALYSGLALSLVKFVSTHAHLRAQDLWFVTSSLGQIAGEGTRGERGWLVLAAALPLALAALFYALARGARRTGAPATASRRFLALALSGASALVALALASPPARWALTTLIPETAAVSRWFGSLADARWRPDPANDTRIAPWHPQRPSHDWNVVVLMLESIPWKRLYGPDARAGSTPRLDALSAESIVFDRAYATSTHSDYAQTSILASLHPRKGDAHDYFADLSHPRALPWDVLGPLGWRTGVFSTQNERWGNMIAFLRTPALETLRHAPDFPDVPRRGTGAETKIFERTAVDAFLAWVSEAPGRPFVAYLNFQATHYPYVWPDGFEPPYGAAPLDFPTTFFAYPRERIPRMLDRFHNALSAVDGATGELLDGLAELGLVERTALVVVADHGEAFYEHGLPTHGTTLHEEQVRVPMLLRLPGHAPRTIAEPVSVLDALPTLYRALGLPRHGGLQGRDDLLAPGYRAGQRPFLFTIQGLTREDGVLLADWKWIVNHDRRSGALFDLRQDPAERRDLTLAMPTQRQALESVLDRALTEQLGYYRARGWEAGWFPPRAP